MRKLNVVKFWIPAFLLVMAMAGCGGAHSMQYYQLTVPTQGTHPEPNPSGVSLALGPLVASHLYREDRIVYSAGTLRMGTYEFQRWSEPPAELARRTLSPIKSVRHPS